MSTLIRNGGFEQGLLEIAEQEGCISEADKKRLYFLKSLPPNRYEWEENGQKFYRDLDQKPATKILQPQQP